MNHRLPYNEAICKQMCQNEGNLILYKMAFWDFKIFDFLSHKISKTFILRKIFIKSIVYKIFKNRNTCSYIEE